MLLLKAQDSTFKNLKIENGILTFDVTKFGDVFDYDMEIKTKTSATVAKLIRFFEFVTLETNKLDSKYEILSEPIKKKNVQVISNIRKVKGKKNSPKNVNKQLSTSSKM